MQDCSLLILSTDTYQDIWSQCMALHEKYWPDCPYRKYIGSDTLPQNTGRFESLGTGQSGLEWSDRARRILLQIKSEYVLLMLEDFFLKGYVDTMQVQNFFRAFVELNGSCLRLYPNVRWMKRLRDHPEIGEHQKGLPYRTSLQATFWKKNTLLSLLVPGEDPWQFELYGGLRSDKMKEPFFASYCKPIPYFDVLDRGKWLPRGIRLCKKEGLPIDLNIRPAISFKRKIQRFWSNVIGFMLHMIPISIRKKIREFKHRKYNLQKNFR